jgi:hypothetical protein|tara:strand:+ start:312 stop:638 length:327 start_codon:yes stop_codon:yes gene_type:complete
VSDDLYNKRVIFRENDKVHAQLRIRLNYDGISQSDFFRGCIEAYLGQESEFEDFVTLLRSKKSKHGKVRTAKSKKLEEKGKETVNKLALNPSEIENIFDMIEEEHEGL